MRKSIRLKICEFAYKLLEKEKDKWESGLSNQFFESQDAYSELVEFYKSKGGLSKWKNTLY